MASLDPLMYAVSCINALEKSFTKHSDVLRRFRTRARELSESAYYNDLAYLFAYIASKSAERYIVGDLIQKELSELVRNIESAKEESPEAKSYGLYGAFLSKYIHDSKLIAEAPKELGQLLLLLRERSLSITPVVLDLAGWLKRLAEAKFESE